MQRLGHCDSIGHPHPQVVAAARATLGRAGAVVANQVIGLCNLSHAAANTPIPRTPMWHARGKEAVKTSNAVQRHGRPRETAEWQSAQMSSWPFIQPEFYAETEILGPCSELNRRREIAAMRQKKDAFQRGLAVRRLRIHSRCHPPPLVTPTPAPYKCLWRKRRHAVIMYDQLYDVWQCEHGPGRRRL